MFRAISPRALLLLAVFLSVPMPSHSCVCEAHSLETQEQVNTEVSAALENYSAIFSGEVIEITLLQVTFKTEHVWKGKQQETIAMITGRTKVSENIYSDSSCTFGFSKGKRYIVFARTSTIGLLTDKCSLTMPIEKAGRVIKSLDELAGTKEKKQLTPE
jgi:hypothetical protein